MSPDDVYEIYKGSNGEATKALYARLSSFGAQGAIAVELFRAQKASSRAKAYRGGVRGRGSYRSMAYDRKGWALGNLCGALARDAADIAVVWGWGVDAKEPVHRHVLYVDLPTGQVSFHSGERYGGPDYAGEWDGVRGASVDRILRWVRRVLAEGIAAENGAEALAQSGLRA
jgi:hypothetical protein